MFREASPVLYEGRTVRGSVHQLEILLYNGTFRSCVEKIEVEVEIEDCTRVDRTRAFIPMLRRLQALPRNRSTIILSDCLGMIESNGRDFVTVREFATMVQLGEVTCIDVGRFSCEGPFEDTHIVHRKLVKMWPEVLDTPRDYNVCSEALALVEAAVLCPWFHRASAWAAQTSLRRWIGLFDEAIRVSHGEGDARNKNDGEKALLVRFLCSTRNHTPWHVDGHGSRFKGMLNELRPGDDPSTLESATDFISINIEGYNAEGGLYGYGRTFKLRAAHWVETDGGMHTLQIMGTHVVSALRGEADAYYLHHPVVYECLVEASAFRSFLQRQPPHFVWSRADYLSSIELKRIHLLYMAMGYGPVHHGRQAEKDQWSLQVLKRYLLAGGLVHAIEVSNATLNNTRTAMVCFLRLLQAPKHLRDTFRVLCEKRKPRSDPIHELDTELVRRLAWEYNWVLVHFWRCTVRDGLGPLGWVDITPLILAELVSGMRHADTVNT